MKKTVLFLEHCIDDTVGGSHYCLLEICRAIDTSEYKVLVAFYQKNDLLQSFLDAGAEVIILKPNTPFLLPDFVPHVINKLIRMPINFIKTLVIRPVYWWSILKKYNVSILHLNNTFTTDHDAIVGALLSNTECVAHVRGIQPVIDKMSRKFSKKLSAIISISNAVTDNLLKNKIPDNKINLIFDGISSDRIVNSVSESDIKKQYKLSDTSKIIGIIGNVKVWKGQEVVVDAMLQLATTQPDLHCFIVGSISDNDYYDRLKNKLSGTEAESKVHFVGYQNNVADFLNVFDIFIHASVEPEPFGIVILEAMALSKPVIVSNIGAPKEIILDKISGLLFESGDASSLFNAIQYLMQDEQVRSSMGEQGRKRLHDNFTSQINIDKISKLYNKVLVNE